MQEQLPTLYSEAEAAEFLTISVDTMRRERKSGKIGFTMVGGRTIKYTDRHLVEYLDSRSVEPWPKNKKSPAKSADTGSARDPTAPSGAEHGSIQKLDKRVVSRLAQKILSKRN